MTKPRSRGFAEKPAPYDLPSRPGAKRSVNLTIDGALVDEAKRLGINLSQSFQGALAERVKAERARRWKAENSAALETYNEEIREYGLWADEFRTW